MSDLRQRVPGHSLIDQLLHEWDLGNIHHAADGDEIVIDDAARGWYLGVLGERRIADLLAQLGSEWTVLHSIPAGVNGRDIDHVVVGPGGVFTINTKNHPGKQIWAKGYGLMVDSFKHNEYIQAAMREVRQARTELSRACGFEIPVTGVIVFVDPASMRRTAPHGDGSIRITSDRELLVTLRAQQILSLEQVDRVAAIASRPDTWLRRPEPSTIGPHISLEFAALEEAVGPGIRKAPWQRPTLHAPAERRRTAGSPTARPSRSRSRRKKASATDKLISRVVVPIGALLVFWFWATQIVGR